MPLSKPILVAVSAAFLLVACFDPSYPTELSCGPDSFCPPGQICSSANICTVPGQTAEPDASTTPDARAGLGQLQSISIGEDLSLTLAQTHTFIVTASYEGGMQVEDNALVIWRTTDTEIAFVDFQGIVRPQSAGVVTITADFSGRVATATVTISP